MEERKYSYMLFLIVLIAFKVSAIQLYLHDCSDDRNVNDCELCEHAIHNQNIEFSTTPKFHSFEIDIIPFFPQPESHYNSICISIPINDTYFGRPPPQNKESLNKYYPLVTRL
jgi:hypothetical protein